MSAVDGNVSFVLSVSSSNRPNTLLEGGNFVSLSLQLEAYIDISVILPVAVSGGDSRHSGCLPAVAVMGGRGGGGGGHGGGGGGGFGGGGGGHGGGFGGGGHGGGFGGGPGFGHGGPGPGFGGPGLIGGFFGGICQVVASCLSCLCCCCLCRDCFGGGPHGYGPPGGPPF